MNGDYDSRNDPPTWTPEQAADELQKAPRMLELLAQTFDNARDNINLPDEVLVEIVSHCNRIIRGVRGQALLRKRKVDELLKAIRAET